MEGRQGLDVQPERGRSSARQAAQRAGKGSG